MSNNFSLHFAVGVDGEFGRSNSLPWGSYKEDLEEFWADLTKDANNGRVLVLGGTTWTTLPTGPAMKLVRLFGAHIELLDRDNSLEDIKRKYPHHDFSCIGGAFTLEQVMSTEKVDSVYTTLIGSTEFYRADTYLDMDLVAHTLNSMDIVSSKILEPSNGFTGTRYTYKAK